MSSKFIEQFKRMERLLERVDGVYNKIPDMCGSEEVERDDILAFFQACFHLKDWVIYDEDLDIQKEEVENLINSSECLRICGDLCNKTKHLVIDRPRIDSETRMIRNPVISRGDECIDVSRNFIVISGGKKYDVLGLANECVRMWRKFFSEKGIDWA